MEKFWKNLQYNEKQRKHLKHLVLVGSMIFLVVAYFGNILLKKKNQI